MKPRPCVTSALCVAAREISPRGGVPCQCPPKGAEGRPWLAQGCLGTHWKWATQCDGTQRLLETSEPRLKPRRSKNTRHRAELRSMSARATAWPRTLRRRAARLATTLDGPTVRTTHLCCAGKPGASSSPRGVQSDENCSARQPSQEQQRSSVAPILGWRRWRLVFFQGCRQPEERRYRVP